MELEDVLLDSQSRTKLKILSYLMDRPDIKIHYSDIQKNIKISRTKFNVLIAEMNTEIAELFNVELLQSTNTLVVTAEHIYFNEYVRYLINRGLPYQFVLSSLLHKNEHIEEFLTEHFISRSTALRALNDFKDYVEQMDLKINFSKICLTGSEVKIRYLYMKVLWVGSLGKDIEYSNLKLTQERWMSKQLRCYDLSNISEELVVVHLAISKIRTLQGYLVLPVKGCENLYPEFTYILNDYHRKFTDDEDQVVYLANLFKFQFIFAFYYSSDEDPRLLRVKLFFEELKKIDPVFVKLVQKFIIYVEEQILQNKIKLLPKDRVNIFGILDIHYLINGNMQMFLGLTLNETSEYKRYKQKEFKTIKKQIQLFFKPYLRRESFQWIKYSSLGLIDSLTLLVYPYYQAEVEKKLQVMITPVINYLAIQRIILFLDRLDFIEYSTSNRDFNDSDVILSTYNENISATKKPTYIFQINNQEQDLVNLF
ncbi:helix-turn-helix domain-containing protein [Enterococcus hermanniensis]|uniref:Mga helix-turn-helix domain-containing protein n=1 Tax=Enterococcus hermanniensis TaxID=249189 RepID=A0A1L8TMT5_9ENTE|nr:helix-turn-helix domain-containing protein [Enterococcus hermanniensis]OJG45631.1 hypothetical protein RV04_GL001920 [Enterococcus hermanniensis]